jgi:hypothetical protein
MVALGDRSGFFAHYGSALAYLTWGPSPGDARTEVWRASSCAVLEQVWGTTMQVALDFFVEAVDAGWVPGGAR